VTLNDSALHLTLKLGEVRNVVARRYRLLLSGFGVPNHARKSAQRTKDEFGVIKKVSTCLAALSEQADYDRSSVHHFTV
jgi:hypothetical protein